MNSSIFLKNHSKKRIRERERELEDKEREGDRMKERGRNISRESG
jgi:hypothetical protein